MSEKNLYRRGETWWLRVKINGDEHRESLRCSDVKSARKARDKRMSELAEAFRPERAISWKRAVAEYLDHERDQIGPNTLKRYAVSFGQCEAFLSPLDVHQIDGKTIAALVAARRQKATPATVRRDLTAISRVLDFSETMEWREGNPTLSKRRMLKERRDPVTLPTEESINVVIAAGSPRFGALIRFAGLTGLRQNEIVTAKWGSFNRTAQTMDVIGKGNKRRTIKLSDAAVAHLMAQPVTLRSELIFCREGGSAWTQAASDFTHFRRKAEAEAKREGKPFRRFRFHDLRHLFAVEALRGGMGIYDLSKHLGHTSVKTTEIYLAFLTPEEAQNTAHGSGFTAQAIEKE